MIRLTYWSFVFADTSILNVTVSEVLQDKMNFEIIYPSELSVFLLDYIKLQYDGNTLALILQKSIDVEYIYEKKASYSKEISSANAMLRVSTYTRFFWLVVLF